jgi:hypothetical protein
MLIEPRPPFGSRKVILRPCTELQALENLVIAATKIVKNARWCDLTRSKVNELRRPLLQLKLARRNL